MLPAELPDSLEELLERIKRDFRVADDEHRWHRDRWDRFWRQWHGYKDFKRSYGEAGNDRDGVLRDGQKRWGADLHIPYTYACVETITPRMLSNRPQMLWLPRDPMSAQNTENIRHLLDAQQEKMQYELRLQTTAKTGLVGGLGVQMGFWRREEREVWEVVPNPLPTAENPAAWVRQRTVKVLWDDPDAVDVDPYDWLWDPAGFDISTIGYCFYRTWRSTRYVLDRFKRGDWDLLPDCRDLTAEDIEGQGGANRFSEINSGRKEAAFGSFSLPSGRHVHEVWEYHDGAEVVTILNRELPVRQRENPAWHGELPFHLFRPTETPKQMVGKGEPEPLEDLQQEMDTLRSQRRDNASLKLSGSYFYQDGAIDPADLQHGAGVYNPVNSMTSLRDSIMPMNVGDIPNSSYQEEAALQADIERVTGLSDQTIGAGASSDTATGAQLQNAAANVRIQLKTHRLELETIAPMARQQLLMNQQHILTQRYVRTPKTPEPGEPDQVWAWLEVGPAEVRGDWDVVPVGGSTAPENVPQDRADVQVLMTALGGNPEVDQRLLSIEVMKKAGIKRPERLLAHANTIPPATLQIIHDAMVADGGIPEQVGMFLQQCLEAAKAQEELAPPAPGRVDQQPAGAEQPVAA